MPVKSYGWIGKLEAFGLQENMFIVQDSNFHLKLQHSDTNGQDMLPVSVEEVVRFGSSIVLIFNNVEPPSKKTPSSLSQGDPKPHVTSGSKCALIQPNGGGKLHEILVLGHQKPCLCFVHKVRSREHMGHEVVWCHR